MILKNEPIGRINLYLKFLATKKCFKPKMPKEVREKFKYIIKCYFYNFDEVWSKRENDSRCLVIIRMTKLLENVLYIHFMNLEAFTLECSQMLFLEFEVS